MKPIRICQTYSLLWLCFLVGCSGSNIEIAEVTGTVSQNGKPLPEVKVVFSPDPEKVPVSQLTDGGGQLSQAITDENGKYRLKYRGKSAEFGAEVGWHRVTAIDVMAENSRDNPIPPRISKKYTIGAETDIFFEVKPGEEQTFEFELEPRK